MAQYTREKLIEICKEAVVPVEEWNNRDSYSSQVLLSDIYELLCCNIDFEIEDSTDEHTIWIRFVNITDEQKECFLSHKNWLNIGSREEYWEIYGTDSEMFVGYGVDNINSERIGGYLPTPLRLSQSDGCDWY